MEAASSLPLLSLDNGRLRIEATGATDVGRRRSRNEDSLGLREDAYNARAAAQGYLFAVADGMGGAEKGDVASRLAIESLFETYYARDEDAAPDLRPADALRASFNAANSLVHGESMKLESGMMGTTLVACTIVGDLAIVGNVGDSRAYIIRGDTLRQISDDHSFVNEQFKAGVLSAEEARTSPQRNIITRAVGHQPRVQTDQFQVGPLQAGDLLLLCSDGLHGMVSDDDLLRIAQQPDLRQAAQDYIDAANGNGGLDNITCLLVRVVERHDTESASSSADEDTERDTPSPIS
ncbi:MAG TPA: PP2C family serine/threonine-protein phosphatase [Chloroflexota bacterium]